MQHTLLGAPGVSRRHGPVLRAPRRPGGHLRRFRAVDAGCVRRRSRAVPQLVFAGGNAGRHRARQLRCAGADVHAGRRAERALRDRQPPQAAAAHSARVGLHRTRRPRHAAAPRRRATAGAARRGSSSSRQRRSASSSSTWPPPVPSLLRGFSAPVRVGYDYDDEALALLASHDSDAVNRWDATQRLFINAILRLAHAHRGGAPLAVAAGARARGPANCSATTRATRRCSRSRSRLPDRRVCRVARTGHRSGRVSSPRFTYIERALAASLRDDFVDALSAASGPA